LGGNGVANSTVFGGIAGEVMAQWVKGRSHQAYNESELTKAIEAHEIPFHKTSGNIELIRDELADCMWDQVGISRNRTDLIAARTRLDGLETMLLEMGVGDSNRAFNLTWQDWMNLRNLILVSKSVVEAAISRENSRGAHYREDFPEEGELNTSYFTAVQLQAGKLSIENRPVEFTLVRPGETILVSS
jgi:fumarate reductase flavoprotein subunit